jgi:elongation factor G
MGKPEQIRNIGVFAHIDAGKTTVTEHILFYAGRVHRMGDVDHGTSVMDWMPQERERGITITSAATTCIWRDHNINIIDTPGHVDFTAEVERSLRILDGGVAVFCAVGGVEPQSETVWHQAARYNVSSIAFINKMDRQGADFKRVLEMMREMLGVVPLPVCLPIGAGNEFEGIISVLDGEALYFEAESLGVTVERTGIPEEYMESYDRAREAIWESVAELDEGAMERYFAGELGTDEVRRLIRKGTIQGDFVPVLCGAALRNIGIQNLMDAIVDWLPSPLDLPPVTGTTPTGRTEIRQCSETDPFTALVFKVQSDPHLGRLAYLRVYSGSASDGQSVLNNRTGKKERLTRLVRMHADKRNQLDRIIAGDIAAAGLRSAATGDTLTIQGKPLFLESIEFADPVMQMAIEPLCTKDEKALESALATMVSEDPSLRVGQDEETGQTLIRGMGELHLEIVADRLLREHNVEVRTGKPQVSYRESISREGKGTGEFKRSIQGRGHFGWVVVKVTPMESGVVFENRLTGDELPRHFAEAVERGVKGSIGAGPVTGFPLDGVLVELVGSKIHETDSSELGYTSAGSAALRNALGNSKPILREPIMRVDVLCPSNYLGDVIGDINSRRGRVISIDARGEIQAVCARVPLAELFGYTSALRSLTQGRAGYTMQFREYAEVADNVAAEVLGRMGISLG